MINIRDIIKAYSRIYEGEIRNYHLGIFIEPYCSYVLEGKKTWESRFSINRTPPFNCVHNNDILLIKKSGGPLLGIALITSVLFFKLDSQSFNSLQKEYSELLCIEDPEFWKKKKSASYATLMKLDKVLKVNPVLVEKKDRRGWIVYRNNEYKLEL